jgi:hypothetical protein
MFDDFQSTGSDGAGSESSDCAAEDEDRRCRRKRADQRTHFENHDAENEHGFKGEDGEDFAETALISLHSSLSHSHWGTHKNTNALTDMPLFNISQRMRLRGGEKRDERDGRRTKQQNTSRYQTLF